MKKVSLTLGCLMLSLVTLKAQTAASKSAASQSMQVQQQSAAAAMAPSAAPVMPAPQPPDPNAGKFEFKEETHDFGTVPEGPLAETDFEFKNVGKMPIVINDAKGSCGCTVPTWPRNPIMPGEKGTIHVAYTSNGRPGMISKEIMISSNAQQNPMVLHIRGSVTPKPVETPKESTATPKKS